MGAPAVSHPGECPFSFQRVRYVRQEAAATVVRVPYVAHGDATRDRPRRGVPPGRCMSAGSFAAVVPLVYPSVRPPILRIFDHG